ncbi:TerC family protein [Portibacter lacus]|uniref:Membrane protein n=1 Tax=Portibacter lacus TaxID=1099794 RepID=A0AA37ST73_9BACT|nr:TerC family protein [Portibacter lacus]GLR19622.1 membrane protein [Portibacter lacus]
MMELIPLIVMPDFGSSAIWLSLITLTFLEIVLGVDNIIFISITSNKLEEKDRKKATNIGLLIAMGLRIALLFGISVLIAMEKPWLNFDFLGIKGGLSGQSLILIIGGVFLLYKSVTEIHHKLEGEEHEAGGKTKTTLQNAIIQIAGINLIFSIDSILTAVGMTNGLQGALVLMVIAVVLSVLVMMLFANPVTNFVNKHPTIQMLGLSFLILIGFMLIIEGAHLGHITIAGSEIGAVPKGYLYFAIAFALLVEVLNIKLRKKQKPIQLHGYGEEATVEGLMDDHK